MHMEKSLAGDPKQAFGNYILELEHSYYPWYKRYCVLHTWLWVIGQTVAILSGVFASVLAALATEQMFSEFQIIRILLIVLPALGALASTVLIQTRVRELMGLREQGREAIQRLISEAKVNFAAIQDDHKRMSELHMKLVRAVSQIERQQAREFLSIIPDTGSVKNNTAAGQNFPQTEIAS